MIDIALTKPITFLVVLFVTWIIAELLKRLVGRILQFSAPQLSIRFQQFTYFLIWIFGLLFAINQLGVSTDILLWIIGLIGIMSIIALRDILGNIFSRPFLEAFYTFKVGDIVKVGKYTGKIIEFNLLNTIILSGERGKNILINVPNSIFLKQATIHKSPYTGLGIKIPIVIDSRLNVTELEKRILGVCKQFKADINWKKPPILLTSRLIRGKKELLLLINLNKLERKAHVMLKLNERIREIVKNMEERLQSTK